ncbi:MAG TPA: hypothetical protein VNG13_08405 [Mycobacteriales bacterium]|nr:hypothetical protein [Mycobacteriales bacterium]
MTLLADPIAPEVGLPSVLRVPRRRPLHRRLARVLRPTEGRLVFLLAVAGYVATAVALTFHYGLISVDGISRTANAAYVVDSRFPHLAAIGFVWNPLPSLVQVPFVPLGTLWPALLGTGFLGDLQSAAFMAGSVALVCLILRDWGCSRPVRYLLTALYALHPLVIYYGADGMSEAALLFCVLLATRYLARWLRLGRDSDLVRLGLALALGYTARYETLATGAAAVAAVVIVAARRSTVRGARGRLRSASVDGFLAGAPFVFAVALWAVTSKIIVKAWFPTFSSSYGNSQQVSGGITAIRRVTGLGTPREWGYLAHQLFALEPLALIAITGALALAVVRRDNRVIAPLAALGALLLFDVLAFSTGHTYGWLRFYIAEIPLTVLLAGSVAGHHLAALRNPPRNLLARWLLATSRVALNVVLATVAVVIAAPGLVTGYAVMTNPTLGREEAGELTAVLAPVRATPQDRQSMIRFTVERRIAQDIAALHLRHGAVLTDSGNAFAVLANAPDMRTYVITSDYDFQPAVADPPRFHVEYLLVPSSTFFDAVEAAYPTLYADGGGFATLVRFWRGTFWTPDWKLYKITDPAVLSGVAAG